MDEYYKDGHKTQLRDIVLDPRKHESVLNCYAKHYSSINFNKRKTDNYYYYYENDFFSYGDAILLSCFIREHRPQNILEVGSGFSTAVIIDTIRSMEDYNPSIKIVDVDHERTRDLGLEKYVTLHEKKFQELEIKELDYLNDGDLIFIDSSHVLKCGSDLHHLFFHLIPNLNKSLYIHFHDIFLSI